MTFLLSFGEKITFYSILFAEQFFGKTRWKDFLNRRRAAFFHGLEKKFATLQSHRVLKVESRTDLSSEQFKSDFFSHSKPVVFEGAASAWPCVQKWNLDFMSGLLGKKDLLLVDVNGLTSFENKKDYELLTVNDLVENIRSGGDKYLRFSPLIQQNPEMLGDLNLPWLNSMKSKWSIGNTLYMFMGGKGTVTLLHSDQPCNLFIQIYGQKKWTLYSADDSVCLYPQATQTAYFRSEINYRHRDPTKHSLLTKATRWEVTLNPGDVLYVPPHTWHHVENLSDTIGVGFRFSSLKAAMKASPLFTFLRVCAQNPPMWKSNKYGKLDTNLIWAHANGNIKELLKKIKLNEQGIQRSGGSH